VAEPPTLWDHLSNAKWIVIWGVLGAYGAIEAFFRLLHGAPKLWYSVSYRWRNRQLGNNFYYKFREASYRIFPEGRRFLYIRRETVVSTKNELTEVPFSYRWTGDGTVTQSIIPGSFKLADAPRIRGQSSQRKSVQFDKPLAKKEEQTYTITLDCSATGKMPEDFLGSTSSHRVDQLVMRVIFPLERLPKLIFCVSLDKDGHEISRQAAPAIDPITGECRYEIMRPEAHTVYQIDWEY
jgi:hypothetical protein